MVGCFVLGVFLLWDKEGGGEDGGLDLKLSYIQNANCVYSYP